MKTLLKEQKTRLQTQLAKLSEDAHSLNYLNYHIPESLLAVKYSEKLILTLRIYDEYILKCFLSWDSPFR